ncbi:uncharacterized protein LOC122053930 [Zingiber officinale]|uniref:Uncharacterized protein n=1 Tax=Zingiber officinale TaxID=94328 RepID=A0A8J5LB56_ZINOF|nr:uncharacterized protein LOC122053930 [Zingiber officinale]KAG6521562.1 hypothetical protein ZIOFF_018686 [Zingiber officinale]
MDASLARRVWDVICAACGMIRKGFCKHRVLMEVHLLLMRGKLAGKAITKLLLEHHRRPDSGIFPVDPLSLSFHRRDDVEFSCSSTPSPVSFFHSKLLPGRRRGDRTAAASAEALALEFETLVSAAESPATLFWQSPVAGRLRITDTPFPAREDGEADCGRVDLQAEAFIKGFYEQLRMQQSLPATPECRDRGAARGRRI